MTITIPIPTVWEYSSGIFGNGTTNWTSEGWHKMVPYLKDMPHLYGNYSMNEWCKLTAIVNDIVFYAFQTTWSNLTSCCADEWITGVWIIGWIPIDEVQSRCVNDIAL